MLPRTPGLLALALALYLLCGGLAAADRLRHRKDLDCPNCLFERSDADGLRLEAIKRQILSKLGLRHKPNVTAPLLSRELIMQTLLRAQDPQDFFNAFDNDHHQHHTTSRAQPVYETVDIDDFYGRTKEIITFAEQGSKVNQNRLLEFRVSPESGALSQDLRVRSASLWLKADFIPLKSTKCKTQVYVFKIISNRLPESVTLSDSQFSKVADVPVALELNETNGGWQKVDLSDVVRTWLTEHRTDKLKLMVDCGGCCRNWHIHLFNSPLDRSSSTNRPFLVVHTDPNTSKRVRRRAMDCSADTGNQCCKQRFYVNFKSLGWDDWIIAPQGYYANYCRGDCGHHRGPDMYLTYHSHVIEEVRKTQHLSGMQPCCAPLKFSSMSLIYYDEQNSIIKRDLPKMVVDECGCP